MLARPCYTIITDTGQDQFHVGKLKGILLQYHPDAQIIDVTHGITPFNIVEAAYQLRSSYHYFPKGTVHIVHVHTYYDDPSVWIAFRKKEYGFVGPNNGLFSLVFPDLPDDIRVVGQTELSHVWSGEVMGKAAARLFQDDYWHTLSPLPKIEERIHLQPVIKEKEIRGTIIHIDAYQNLITNIHQSLFESVRNGRQFALYFKRFDPITYLSSHYGEVEIGETLCRFNSTGYLEIAMNLAHAAEQLGLKQNDTIQIEFF